MEEYEIDNEQRLKNQKSNVVQQDIIPVDTDEESTGFGRTLERQPVNLLAENTNARKSTF